MPITPSWITTSRIPKSPEVKFLIVWLNLNHLLVHQPAPTWNKISYSLIEPQPFPCAPACGYPLRLTWRGSTTTEQIWQSRKAMSTIRAGLLHQKKKQPKTKNKKNKKKKKTSFYTFTRKASALNHHKQYIIRNRCF